MDETLPDVLIHCAALANLEACEANPETAKHVNAVLPGEFALETHNRGIRMVHISTDAVFDGQIPLPQSLAPIIGGYQEGDAPNPLSVYARTKLDGELAVSSASPDAIIARVNFFGWSLSGRRSLSEFFFNNLSTGNQVKGFTDVFFCPLLANHLGRILLKMVEKGLTGLYHVVSPEAVSKDEFGRRLARRFGLDESLITPTSVTRGGLKAARSPNLVLSTQKLTEALGEPAPDINAGLEEYYNLWKQGYPNRLVRMNG